MAPTTPESAADAAVYSDGGSTIAPSEDSFSDHTSDTEPVDMLSDNESEYGDVKPQRKIPSTPTTSSPSSSRSPAGAQSHTPPSTPKGTEPEAEAVTPPRGRGRPRGSIPLTDAHQAQIVALREAGWTCKRIADHINRSPNTIKAFIRRRKIKMDHLISTLPGSASPAQQPAPKTDNTSPTRAGASTGGRPAKRERTSAAKADSVDSESREAKPSKRARKTAT